MESLNQTIASGYRLSGLYEIILGKLEELGVDLHNVSRKDLASVDEFHVCGAAVSDELARTIDLNGKSVLDIGCGIGGPCRMLAQEFNCTVTGIDLTDEYVRTATLLTELVGLSGTVDFKTADAADLPFENGSFDVVWTQHVQMNIPDKKQYYAEAARVLKPGGHFLYYDILKVGNGAISYPITWANTEDVSFLATSDEMAADLEECGLVSLRRKDHTQEGVQFFETLIGKLKEFGPPKLGLNVLMGESTKPKIMSLYTGLRDGALKLESGVYRKP